MTEADLLTCLRVGAPATEERELKVALQSVRQFMKETPSTLGMPP